MGLSIMGKSKRNNHARPRKHPPRSASAARGLPPVLIENQQAVSVDDLVEGRIIQVNGKGEVIYAGE